MKKLLFGILLLASTLTIAQEKKRLVTFKHVASQNNEILQKFKIVISSNEISIDNLKADLENVTDITKVEYRISDQAFILHSVQSLNADDIRVILQKNSADFDEKTVTISNFKKYHFSK